MTNNKPTRASQTKSDSTKVQSQAKTVAPKARPKKSDTSKSSNCLGVKSVRCWRIICVIEMATGQ